MVFPHVNSDMAPNLLSPPLKTNLRNPGSETGNCVLLKTLGRAKRVRIGAKRRSQLSLSVWRHVLDPKIASWDSQWEGEMVVFNGFDNWTWYPILLELYLTFLQPMECCPKALQAYFSKHGNTSRTSNQFWQQSEIAAETTLHLKIWIEKPAATCWEQDQTRKSYPKCLQNQIESKTGSLNSTYPQGSD